MGDSVLFDSIMHTDVFESDGMERNRRLEDLITAFDISKEMSMSDVAQAIRIMPEAAINLGIESALTYEASHHNYVLAQELSNGGKAVAAAALAALIGLLLKFLKISNSSGFLEGGGGGATRNSELSTKANQKETEEAFKGYTTTYDAFTILMGNFKGSQQVLLSEDVTKLSSAVGSVVMAANRFGPGDDVQFEADKDGSRIGMILNQVKEKIDPTRMVLKSDLLYNFIVDDPAIIKNGLDKIRFFLSALRDTDFAENTRKNVFLRKNAQYNMENPLEYDNLKLHMRDQSKFMENVIQVRKLGKAIGLSEEEMEPSRFTKTEVYQMTVKRFARLASTLFGTYPVDDNPDPIRAEKRQKEYFNFMTTGYVSDTSKLMENTQSIVEAAVRLNENLGQAEIWNAEQIVGECRETIQKLNKTWNVGDPTAIENPEKAKEYNELIEDLFSFSSYVEATIQLMGVAAKIVIKLDKIETFQQNGISAIKDLNDALLKLNEKLGKEVH